MGELLSIRGLDFGYRKKQVLSGISFSADKGMICGLLGPNASGKTTLLRCVNGLLKPQRGEIHIGGRDINGMSRRDVASLMAAVPQQVSVAFSFTALQMVLMGRAARLKALSLPSSKDREEASAALHELGVGGLAHRPFNELSGGEKQLVLLARAIYQDTPVLLLDEPVSHLDFKNQFMIMDVVSNLTRRKGLATVVSLHDPNLALRYCDRLVVLKDGTLYREGPCDEIMVSKTISELYGMDVVIERNPGLSPVIFPAGKGRLHE